MTEYSTVGTLRVAAELRSFLEQEALADTAIPAADFWSGLARLIADLTPRNRELLAERDRLQAAIDDWHSARAGLPHDAAAYRQLLTDVGYLLPEPAEVSVSTTGVDDEIAVLAGPQLVVPVLNARFVLNAANARWGSLYDALYGTDAVSEDGGAERRREFNDTRRARVVALVRDRLDATFGLQTGSHHDARSYRVVDGALQVGLGDGRSTALCRPDQLRGHTGPPQAPTSILLRQHGLHVQIVIDADSHLGRRDPAGVADVIVEAAITTIVDFEDSVAAVDAADKVAAYRNWLQLNRGLLSAPVEKDGRSFTRSLNADRQFTAPDGTPLTLPGRSLLFARNVGHLMTTDAVLDADGAEIGEGILDAVVTSLCALPGLAPDNAYRNSRTGSIYIVKPKMHGPAEVAFTVRLFEAVETLLGLAPLTLKIGIMDEERRTSLNLAAAIHEARERIVFINTGFLDRSGDEIHTSMLAGPIVAKAKLKDQPWISAYEDRNVDVGLAAGLPGRAQIGKGMWAMPDLMGAMLAQKVAQPQAGASTAWVPSPSAATLHALHYHEVDVAARQRELRARQATGRDALLEIPLVDPATLSAADRAREIDNNTQSILGYVVRWVDQGIGCSKVPDIHGVALMEDRATLRISSQLLANWLRHRIVTAHEVQDSLRRMAAVVDGQNAGDPAYRPMAPSCDGHAFAAAQELIFDGAAQPNGYTEPILHRRRRLVKEDTTCST